MLPVKKRPAGVGPSGVKDGTGVVIPDEQWGKAYHDARCNCMACYDGYRRSKEQSFPLRNAKRSRVPPEKLST
jgi:hypothetical protein